MILPWRNAVLSEKLPLEVDLTTSPRRPLPPGNLAWPWRAATATTIPRGDLVLHFGVGDIFVIAGQSNASGRGRDPIYDPPELGVHALRNSGRWSIATHPLNETTGSIFDAHYGNHQYRPQPGPRLCQKLKRELGYPIGLLQTALGGKKISYWKPDGTGILYTEMVDMIKTYCFDGVKGVYWHQGCNDAAEFESDFYYDRFQEMVEHLRADLRRPRPAPADRADGPDTAAVARTEQSDYNWAVLREAQRRAAHQLPNIYIVPSNDLKLYDMIHNCSASHLILGERLASAAL